jgi:DnaJ-class molecular chaperone
MAYTNKKNIGTNAIKKEVQDGFAILSDPAKRQQYDTTMRAFYAANPPNLANISQMLNKSGRPNPLKIIQGLSA